MVLRRGESMWGDTARPDIMLRCNRSRRLRRV